MIQIDLVLAIAVFLSVSLAIVFVLWIFYNFRGGKDRASGGNVEDVQQCPYCTHVFVKDKEDSILRCPQCKSYIGDTPFVK